MKRPNKYVTRAFAVTTTVSILTSSCEGYFQDNLYYETDFAEKGEEAISIKFSKEEMQYLQFLDRLGGRYNSKA